MRDLLYDGLRIGSIGAVKNQPCSLEIGAETKLQSAVTPEGGIQKMSGLASKPLDLPGELFDFLGHANQRE